MNKTFWADYKKPIIGLAPMHGYTDSAFRLICKEINPDIIVFTEFTSAEGLCYGAERVIEKFHFFDEEQPVIAQIFGNNPNSYLVAAKYCQDVGFSGIDINMGCSAKKVVKQEQGIALRKKHDLAFRLIETVATATDLPVSVKTRLGWKDCSDLIDFGKGCERAGADLLTVHGRTYFETYGSPADLKPIYELKREMKIPVLGNGGITSMQDGMKKIGNLDGFLIGQASFGNPWVFSYEKEIPFEDRVATIKRHAELAIETHGEKAGMLIFRKHLLAYIRGIPGASKYRRELSSIISLDEVNTLLDSIVANLYG